MRHKKKQAHHGMILLVLILFAVFLGCTRSGVSFATDLKDVPRISVAEARQHSLTGQALLICAYENERCRKIMLEGALRYSELKAQLPDVAKDKELIFYCA